MTDVAESHALKTYRLWGKKKAALTIDFRQVESVELFTGPRRSGGEGESALVRMKSGAEYDLDERAEVVAQHWWNAVGPVTRI